LFANLETFSLALTYGTVRRSVRAAQAGLVGRLHARAVVQLVEKSFTTVKAVVMSVQKCFTTVKAVVMSVKAVVMSVVKSITTV
jgi:hypothetical protein